MPRLLFRSWNDDSAVVCYDTISGDTHLLNPLAAETLSQLQRDATLSLDVLATRVAASLDIEVDEDLVRAIEQILSEFTERGVLAHT